MCLKSGFLTIKAVFFWLVLLSLSVLFYTGDILVFFFFLFFFIFSSLVLKTAHYHYIVFVCTIMYYYTGPCLYVSGTYHELITECPPPYERVWQNRHWIRFKKQHPSCGKTSRISCATMNLALTMTGWSSKSSRRTRNCSIFDSWRSRIPVHRALRCRHGFCLWTSATPSF